jgi:hypothetical protein
MKKTTITIITTLTLSTLLIGSVILLGLFDIAKEFIK